MLAHTLTYLGYLKCLRLENCELDESHVRLLSQSVSTMSTLKELDLSGNKGIGPVMLHGDCLKTLHTLKLARTGLSDSSIGTLCHCKLANIEELDLSGNPIGSCGVVKLVDAIVNDCLPTLTKLGLADNMIDSEGVAILANSFKHIPHLSNLDLSYNEMIGPRGIEALFNNLVLVPNLETLKLNGVRLQRRLCVTFPKLYRTLCSYNLDLSWIEHELELGTFQEEKIQMLRDVYKQPQ